ncbi:MAG: T9SS type A sorting domain-containing protein [Flavobacteriales bacterium]|jgi:hypothetical protein|nr:T9SS type A sorting domain-containing protein [Flavobacteriales bacterium]
MPLSLKTICVVVILFLQDFIYCQNIINGYATVTAISGRTLTLSNVDESGDTFEDGEAVIIMQMQDSVIGSNTNNNSSFGDLGTIASAGLYEIRFISSHTESGTTPNTITLNAAMTNTYNINVNSTVQIISFPTLGTPHYTTTADLTGKAWDGNNGGVLAMNILGNLNLSHNITVSGLGFRGGSASANFSGWIGCDHNGDYIKTANHARAGKKGEGIYKAITNDYRYARGKLINGGGGGTENHNCGGAGGGNYTNGGNGGYGYSCATAPGGGGVGGLELAQHIRITRFFMGGGGGGGQQNNSVGTAGGAGGGIILIKADSIKTLGNCSGITISANGASVPSGRNDGQGGGGAGGSIVLDVNGWDVASTCRVTMEASGGDGGDVLQGTSHAGGGGGGQGVIMYPSEEPNLNTTISVNSGSGGCSKRPCDPSTTPPNGGGTDGDGASPAGSTNGGINPLPVELLFFWGEYLENGTVELDWQTVSELNNSHFIIERSSDFYDWEQLHTELGAGNSISSIDYRFLDEKPLLGTAYYRLKQVDFDGQEQVVGVEVVAIESSENLYKIYPIPTKGKAIISSNSDIRNADVLGYTIDGKLVDNLLVSPISNKQLELNTENLLAGVYILYVNGKMLKLIKE